MKKILCAAAFAVFATVLRGEPDGHFMLSFFSPGELPVPTSSIAGARLSLVYGECHEFAGIDVGLAGFVRDGSAALHLNAFWNGVGTDLYGVQLGLANTVEGTLTGFQGGLFGMASGLEGWQLGLANVADQAEGVQTGLANFADDFSGIQIGLVGSTEDFGGFQLGLANATEDFGGLQIGLVNVAGEVGGVQIGVVNTASSLSGVQIGLANFSAGAGLPFCPVLNAGW